MLYFSHEMGDQISRWKLQADVLALPPGILARYFHCTDRMVEFGPDLGMPHTQAMSMGLFELRLKSLKNWHLRASE